MPAYLFSLPVLFLKFWFIEAPFRLFKYFLSVNHAFLQFLSLALVLKTFFKPLKNEYRKGLVLFSVIFGIFLKTILIFIDLFFFSLLMIAEIVIIILFVAWPFLTFYILFI